MFSKWVEPTDLMHNVLGWQRGLMRMNAKIILQQEAMPGIERGARSSIVLTLIGLLILRVPAECTYPVSNCALCFFLARFWY